MDLLILGLIGSGAIVPIVIGGLMIVYEVFNEEE